MEMVDILVRLIDVTVDKFHLQDVGICEFSVRNRVSENSLEIVTLPSSNHFLRFFLSI